MTHRHTLYNYSFFLSVLQASSLLPQSNASYSTAAASSTLPQPSSSAGKSSSSNVLQTLLSANPLELNSALQNLLLTAANSSTSSLTEAQKTLINTLVAITSTSNPGGSADGVAGPGGSAGGLLCTQQRPQSSEGMWIICAGGLHVDTVIGLHLGLGGPSVFAHCLA